MKFTYQVIEAIGAMANHARDAFPTGSMAAGVAATSSPEQGSVERHFDMVAQEDCGFTMNDPTVIKPLEPAGL